MKEKKIMCIIVSILCLLVVLLNGIFVFCLNKNVTFLQVISILVAIICGVCFGESYKNTYMDEEDVKVLRQYGKQGKHKMYFIMNKILFIVFILCTFGYILMHVGGDSYATIETIEQNDILQYFLLSVISIYFSGYCYQAAMICRMMQEKDIDMKKSTFHHKPLVGTIRLLKMLQLPAIILIVIMLVIVLFTHILFMLDTYHPYLFTIFGIVDQICMMIAPIIVILFIASGVLMEPLKDQWNNQDMYSKSKLYLMSVYSTVFIAVYHIVSFFGKSVIGTGSVTPSSEMMNPLYEYPSYCLHELMFRWSLMLIGLHVFLLFSQKRYEYEIMRQE